MSNHDMEKDSFLWSEVRLVIAALALFLGGVPVVYVLLPVPFLFGLERLLLAVAWIVSGIASCYLLYEWNKRGQKVFGGKATPDVVAFFVMVISGINLGLAGIFQRNIGMLISSNHIIFDLVGILYLWSAWHLWTRWNASGKKMF